MHYCQGLQQQIPTGEELGKQSVLWCIYRSLSLRRKRSDPVQTQLTRKSLNHQVSVLYHKLGCPLGNVESVSKEIPVLQFIASK